MSMPSQSVDVPPNATGGVAPPPRKGSGSGNLIITLAVIAGVAMAVEGGVLLSLYNEHIAQTVVEESAARQRAAQEQAERERLAQEEAAREAAARKADEERKARQEATAKAARESSSQSAKGREPRSDAAAPSLNLEWQDHAIRYVGVLRTEGGNAKMSATLYDLRTGARIGSYNVPMRVAKQGTSDYAASGEFAIPRDSVTPYPHSHISNLLLHVQRDGSVRLVQNCPRDGECYPGT